MTYTSARELGIMANWSMQTGVELSPGVVDGGHATTAKRAPPSSTMLPSDVPGGMSMLTPSTETSCINIGVQLALSRSWRS
jgi:hypothetical protein